MYFTNKIADDCAQYIDLDPFNLLDAVQRTKEFLLVLVDRYFLADRQLIGNPCVLVGAFPTGTQASATFQTTNWQRRRRTDALKKETFWKTWTERSKLPASACHITVQFFCSGSLLEGSN